MTHQKLGNGQNTEQETDIAVVAPSNMGKGIRWDEDTGTYYIPLGKGLKLNENGELELEISQDTTNTLSLKNDGAYQGPKAERSQYFVDYENGNDDNEGSYEKPMRTLVHALSKVPMRTNNVTIFLKEAQRHIVNSHNGIYDFSVRIEPYGPKTTELENRWKSGETGWHVYAAKEYEPIRPTLYIVPTFQLSSDPNGFSPQTIFVEEGNVFLFNGIKFAIDTSRPIVKTPSWVQVLAGRGSIECLDCTFLNDGFAEKGWAFFGDHGSGRVNVRLTAPLLQSQKAEDHIFAISAKIYAIIESRQEREHANLDGETGLTWLGTTPYDVVIKSVRGAGEPVMMSKNFVHN